MTAQLCGHMVTKSVSVETSTDPEHPVWSLLFQDRGVVYSNLRIVHLETPADATLCCLTTAMQNNVHFMQTFYYDGSSPSHAFSLFSSHLTQTGSWESPRRKYRPSINSPLHSYDKVSTMLSDVGQAYLTMQTKHLSCQSDPSALTTKSVTGLRHLRHLLEYRFV